MDLATVDKLLTTTRTVRKRLDLTRSVDPEIIQTCLEIAIQAPTGGNIPRYHFVVVTDAAKRTDLAALYKRAYFEVYSPQRQAEVSQSDPRLIDSATYLAEHMYAVPVLIIPCVEAPPVQGTGPGAYASILPATWSLMLALRARRVGSAWTTLHLRYEQEAAAVLGIPDGMRQAALLPVAYYTGGTSNPPNVCLHVHGRIGMGGGRRARRAEHDAREPIDMGGFTIPGRVEGKVALVTGGASGIGRATALTFAREGAKLVVADMNEEGGHQTVHMITENGGEATFVQVDVTQATAVEALISKTVETYGRLDYAYNNAGVTQRAYPPTAEFPEEDWHRVLAINLTGVWLCMKYEIPQMLKQGGGAIVNTASVAGLVGLAGRAAYVASKHGVVGITRTAALEYAQQGIRVNCVCPGYIRTPMVAYVLQQAGAQLEEQMVAREPIGRLGTPEEVAEAVVWLCSDAASFVTGHMMTVDGGYVAQ